MTAVKTLPGVSLLVQIGDGNTPEVFAHDCLINLDRAFNLAGDTNDVIVPDCDDPSAPAFKQRFIDGISGDVTGSGKLHTASAKAWQAWLLAGTSKNIRVNINVAGALGGGYWSFAAKLASFSVSGSRNDVATSEVSLVSHGTITWVDNA